jgi:WXG100 family type VII secretion target
MTDLIHEVLGIFDPGGDPDAIRAAAAACRALAGDLNDMVRALDPDAANLERAWKGKASAGFQSAWSKFAPSVTDYASNLDEAAQRLDKVADYIQEAQVQARNFEIAMGITAAAGLALTIFTFGFSDAAAAEADAADAGAIATLMARLAGLLAGEADAWAGLISAAETTAARFVLGAGMTILAEATIKAMRGLNPLDPDNWDANDATNALIGAWLLGGMGAVSGVQPVSAMLADHPIIGSVAGGIGTGTIGGLIGQLWLDGHSLDSLQTWEAIGASAGIAAVTGGLLGAGSVALSGLRSGGDTADDGLPGGDETGPPSLVGPSGRPIIPDTWEEQPPVAGKVVAADANGRVAADTNPVQQPPPKLAVADASGRVISDAGPTPEPAGALVSADGQPLIGADGRPVGGPDTAPAEPAPALVGPDGRPLLLSTGPDAPPPAPADAGPSYPAGLQLNPSDVIRAANRYVGGVGQYVVLYPRQQTIAGPGPPPALQPTPALPKPPPPAPPSPPPVSYTVQPGDNLFDIAHGNPALVQQIARANHLTDPALIRPGQVLIVPPAPPASYTVQPGDNIWTIAGGNPALVQQIIEANHLTDPALIQPGQVLIIPPPVAEPAA